MLWRMGWMIEDALKYADIHNKIQDYAIGGGTNISPNREEGHII
jgi:hypothetical protein